MRQAEMSIIEFQHKFASEEDCRVHLFQMRWPKGYQCPRCSHDQAYFHRTRHLYQCKSCGYQASLTAGTVFHRSRTPLTKWFWMIFLIGRQKSGVSMLALQHLLEIKSYKTVWLMGHKIRKAMQERDAYYRLAGLVEMDDTFFGPSKSGKRGRGAAGKTTVVVAVESRGSKPGFAKMQRVERLDQTKIQQLAKTSLWDDAQIRTDGLNLYRILDTKPGRHEAVVVGEGKEASRLLPWVHTLIGNIKNSLRGVYHGVSFKHLPLYLAESCYRFNRRYWEPEMFNRLLAACIEARPIGYAELRT